MTFSLTFLKILIIDSSTANEKVLVDFAKTHENQEFAPDGMTIDDQGNLYIATWDGSRIIVFNPVSKMIIREIMMPVPKITSVGSSK